MSSSVVSHSDLPNRSSEGSEVFAKRRFSIRRSSVVLVNAEGVEGLKPLRLRLLGGPRRRVDWD
jgi:hypothetical protein